MANVVTHASGLVLSVMAVVVVGWIGPRMPLGDAIASMIFAISLVALYAVSTLSHAVKRSALQDHLRALDQGFVYLLIAGTYTPFVWSGDNPITRSIALCGIWFAALCGFYTKVFVAHRVNAVQTYSYLLLGWLPAIFLKDAVSAETLKWIAAGGICYTVGVAFLKNDGRVPFFHAVWHLCVIGGSICHFHAVYRFLMLPRVKGQG